MLHYHCFSSVLKTKHLEGPRLAMKTWYCTHHFLVFADEVSILGGISHIIKKNTKALSIVTKEVGQEVKSNKNTYFVSSKRLKCSYSGRN